ncbi:copper chaperone PCu(A)C [Parasedimentitalea psychrophila]|uniref:Copper chaperone PCu(A)C n=1 Tax=Parasedimentitalea psychrophila TaxID=2997337 RepID=A0A9Y2P519_9RHOB|nr:copper chaperone PCu(A)C [Parasedimentitalea psychrophila]WIY23523.1 copper chaperone PCu(A)C [Parasedimentitalea psychrophila]
MSFKSVVIAAVASLTLAGAAGADMSKIMVGDAYARASNKMAGAAFMAVMNGAAEDDRLISVSSEIAKRTELHTHMDMGEGVMKMMHVEEGFAIAAGETHMLQRGGDHVMFMGLTQELKQGDIISLTLTFENAGEVIVQVPVDLERKPAAGGMGHTQPSN